MASSHTKRRVSRSRRRRALLAVASIIVVLAVGTVGFHAIEGLGYVDSFYFESMLATGQGPPLQLVTDVGKVFASIMAFVSVGAVVTILVFTLGPVLLELLREGIEFAEREAKAVEHEFTGGKADDNPSRG